MENRNGEGRSICVQGAQLKEKAQVTFSTEKIVKSKMENSSNNNCKHYLEMCR